jgi:hypothetical protein
MEITNAIYTDETNKFIKATIDGTEFTLPVDESNRHYKALVDSGVSVAAYVAPDISIDVVRVERDKLLADMDKYGLSVGAAPLPDGVTDQQIIDYKQALRDMTDGLDLTGIKSIDDVTFPTKPF